MRSRQAKDMPLLLAAVSLALLAGTLGWVAWMALGGGRDDVGVLEAGFDLGVETTNHRPASEPRLWVREEARADSSQAMPTAPEGVSAEELRAALEGPGVVSGEVLLTFRSATALGAFRARASVYGLRVIDSEGRLLAARVAYRDVEDLARELREHAADYEDVGPNYVARIPGLPAEDAAEVDAANAGGRAPFEESLLSSIGADGDRSSWGRGVKVAVLDSGVDGHATLEGVRVTTLRLAELEGVSNGHGTAMGSLIAGRVAPATGVAPAVELLDIGVTDAQGVSNTAVVAEGIMRAVDAGADVINISLGTFGSSQMLQNAVAYALRRNVVVVAAAGNERLKQVAYPAAYPGVIAVAAVDAKNQQAYFSNSGSNLTLAAPGVGVISAYPKGQLVIGSGTSQATAVTSGAVAALLSWGYDPSKVVQVLRQSALPTGAPPEQVGAGVLRLPRR